MFKLHAYSRLGVVLAGLTIGCGTATDLTSGAAGAGSSTATSSSQSVTAAAVPASNTANVDAVMADTITQGYLATGAQTPQCAGDANAVHQVLATLAAALGDPNAASNVILNANATTHGEAVDGNVAAHACNANDAQVVAMFEQQLPALHDALDALQTCVRAHVDPNMPAMPTFPCGKPGSSTFPKHGTDGNGTLDPNDRGAHHDQDPNGVWPSNPNGFLAPGRPPHDADDHHHPLDPNAPVPPVSDPNTVTTDPNTGTTAPSAPPAGINNAAATTCVSVVAFGHTLVGCNASGL